MRRGQGRLGRPARRIGLTLVGAVLCAVGLGSIGGCGDGGSSGFDIGAKQRAEQQVITDVAQSADCAGVNGIMICGAHMPASSPVVPVLSDPLSLSPPNGQPLPCVGDATAGCTVIVRVEGGQVSRLSGGVQAGSILEVAVGPVDPPNGWVRGETAVYAVGGPALADLQVTLGPEGRVPLVTGTLVRVAVLVYPPGDELPALPPAVDLLSDFDTGLAVVANDLVLQLSAAP